MKKTRLLSRICALMTVAALLIGMWAISVCAVSGGMSLGDMVAATVASGGEPAAGVGDTIEFSMLKGDFFGGGTLSKFDSFGSAMVGQDADLNFIRNWDFRASTGVDTIIKITAKQNMRLEIVQGDAVSQWAIGSAFYYVTENSKGVRVTAKEIPLAESMSNDNFGMQHHLAAGDSLYVIYKSHTTDPGVTVNANFAPWFQVETDAYDAAQRAVYAGETKEEVLSGDIVSGTVAAQGGVVSKTNADFQFLMGDFFNGGALTPFTTFAGNGDYSYTDIVGDPNGENAAWRWQWRSTAGNNTILKITAKENMMFLVEQRDEIGDQWATNSAYIYVTENTKGERLVCRKMMVMAKMEKDYVRTEIHLAQGDALYIVYTIPSGDGGVVTSDFSSWFVMDRDSYDAEKRAVYAGETEDPADTKEEVLSGDIVSETVAAQGGVVSKTNADFQFLMGDFFGGGALTPFTTFAGNGDYNPADIVGDPNGENAAWRWQWRATAKNNTVLKITAKADMMFLVEQRDEITDEQWATHSAYTYVLVNAEGKRFLCREMMVKSQMERDYVRTEIHLAAGDTLYIVYTIPSGDGGVVTSVYSPWFVMDRDSYDAEKRAEYPNMAEESADSKEEILSGDIVSETVAAQGGVVSKENADFQFLMGDFFRGGALTPFTTFAGNGDYNPADIVGDPNGENAAWRWQWRSTARKNTVLKITAKEDMMFLVEQRDEIGEQWATQSAYIYVMENAEGKRFLCREMMVKSQMEKDYVRTEIHLAAGDTLYIVYTIPSGNGDVVTSDFSSWFVMDPASYNAEKRSQTEISDVPVTGDSGSLAVAGAVMALSIIACGVLLLKKKEMDKLA